ncbi:MAG: N-acetyltransferase family protein [Pseudomonadota bacterium]
MKIRPATAADMDAVAAIYGHSVTTHYASFEVEPPDAADMSERFQALVDENFPYLVAEEDGAVLGYAYASRFRPRPAYGYTVEGTVYIHPDHYGKGIGKTLVTDLISACAARHFQQMMAVIACKPDDDLATNASVRLHLSLGFQQVGRFKEVGHKQGLWLDTVILQRAL